MDKIKERYLKSCINIKILRMIQENHSLHGYAIIKRIREEEGVYFGPSTVYPTLNDLEDEGYLKSEWIVTDPRPRKEYTLTAKGNKRLEKLRTALKVVVQPLCVA